MSNPANDVAFAGQVTELDVDIYDGDAIAELRTLDKSEVDKVLTFDEAVAASGFNLEEIIFIGSPFRILQGKEKEELVNVPFLIRQWRFVIDKDTERPYVVVYAITKNNDMVILTDGSTGIHKQLETLTATRIAAGHPAPFEQAMVANGLRFSEYGVTADGQPAKKGEKVTDKARTYYLA